MVKEADVQQEIQAYVLRSGGYVAKQHGSAYSGAGVPDLLGWIPLRSNVHGYEKSWGVVPFAIEVKVAGKRSNTTPIQEHLIQTCIRAGGASGVATGIISFQRIIAAWAHRNILWGIDSLPANTASLEEVMKTIGVTVNAVGEGDDYDNAVEPSEGNGEVDGDTSEHADSSGDADGEDVGGITDILEPQTGRTRPGSMP